RRFAASPVVSRLRRVHFMTRPIEPLRVLRDTPAALGVADIFFDRASGAGMPFVVEELLDSPLGRVLRGLHFRVGYESLEDLIGALGAAPAIERLSFHTMGLTDELVGRLMGSPAAGHLRELDLRGNPLGSGGVSNVVQLLPQTVHTLTLAGCEVA